jgi:hypothetical protein
MISVWPGIIWMILFVIGWATMLTQYNYSEKVSGIDVGGKVPASIASNGILYWGGFFDVLLTKLFG